MLSLPIPIKKGRSYSQINTRKEGYRHLGDIVEQLSCGKILASDPAHLDPDEGAS